MFRKLATAAIMMLGGSPIVTAADLPRVAPLPVAVQALAYNWTGFYAGAFVGGVWGESDMFRSGGGPLIRAEPHGVFGGLHIGADWQLPNNIVIGARIAAPLGSTADDTVPDPIFGPIVTHRVKLDWAALFTGHLGVAMGRWLPYVGGGFAVGEATATFTTPGTPAGGLADSQTHAGFTVLAGVRYALADRWWAALQYNYTDFGSETYSYPFFGPLATRTVGLNSHAVTAMVSYRFAGGR